MLKTLAIKNFLSMKTVSDLALLYSDEMEVQINVSKGNGEPISGEYLGKRWQGFSDGVREWKPFRIPYNANTEPEYKDHDIKYDLLEHCEGVGMTGWNWKKRVSQWVAFDFDALVGHSEKHTKKLSATELKEIENTVLEVEWATLRKSTSGRGLHLYVHLDDIPTSNHNEHAALARAIISQLTGLTGYDFSSKVDICGGNMWVWHKKMVGTDGLTVIKQGGVLRQVPDNWKEHLKIIARKSKRVRPQQMLGDVEEKLNEFELLVQQKTRTPLDVMHKKLLGWLENNKCRWWWDSDNHMVVCHTYDLKQAHTALEMVGPFQTVSKGTQAGDDHNCFAFPLRNGAWSVRRYGQETAEAATWVVDPKKWTKCFLNKVPDVDTLSRLFNATETAKGAHIFPDGKSAIAALKYIAIELRMPEYVMHRKITVKELLGKNKLTVSLPQEDSDKPEGFESWHCEKSVWTKVFNFFQNVKTSEINESENYDDRFRHIVTSSGEDSGWMLKVGDSWRAESLTHIRLAMADIEVKHKEMNQILGEAVNNGWMLVNKPFQSEYPGDRQWNRNTAQLRCPPSLNTDSLSFPMWKTIFKHCGSSLDDAIQKDEWCIKNGVTSGEQYLILWVASLLQHPTKPLPYLFFWGEQYSGKSMFHEAITEFLIVNGHMRANAALLSSANFNAEIENIIFCIIEEVDLRKNAGEALNKIKEWVTSPEMLIHMKGSTPYLANNYTHWIQTANDRDFCPIFPGDTRITVFRVDMPQELIAKDVMRKSLEKEAPDFLAHLLNIEIPNSEDRLNLPVIATEDKIEAEEENTNDVALFIQTNNLHREGCYVTATDFILAFHAWVPSDRIGFWSSNKVGRAMTKTKYPKGKMSGKNDMCYGNLSLNPDEVQKVYRLKRDGNLLVPQTIITPKPSTNGAVECRSSDSVTKSL